VIEYPFVHSSGAFNFCLGRGELLNAYWVKFKFCGLIIILNLHCLNYI
jgi:hypothetical protein